MPEFSDDLVFYFGLASFAAISLLVMLAISLAIEHLRASRRPPGTTNPLLREREPLTLDQFYEKFYAGSAPRELVSEILLRFARAAAVPAGLLRPEDSFAELNAASNEDAQQLAVDIAGLMRMAEERAQASLFSGQLVTLDDYIRASALAERFAPR